MTDIVADVKKGALDSVSDIERFVIAGDVSATNVEMGLYGITDEEVPIVEATYKGQLITDFNDVLDHLIGIATLKRGDVGRMVLSPAGPISPDKMRCDLTNALFSLDASTLGVTNTILINDYAAIGYAIATYSTESSHVRLKHINGEYGEVIDKEPIAIHGPGTGFGAGRLIYDNESGLYFPLQSEGGHRFLAVDVDDAVDIEIGRWFMGCCDGEKPHLNAILCGNGILNVCEYFISKLPVGERERYIAILNQQEDPAEFIAKNAKLDSDLIYAETMNVLWKHLGMALHDIAVHEVARGGVWIAGGIARKNILDEQKVIDWNIENIIMTNFDSTPSHREWLMKIPVYVLTDNVGRQGALAVATTEEYWKRESFG